MLLLRLGLRLAKFARRAFVASKALRVVGGRSKRLRRPVKEAEKETEKIDRDARGARGSLNELANAVGRLSQSGSQLGRSGVIDVRIRTNAHEVADELERLEAEIEDAARRTMEKAVLMVQAEAQRRAPVDTGTLRRSITGQVRPLGAQPAGSLSARKVGNAFPGQKVGLVGTVGTKLNYGAAVEYGRKPGKRPPTAALKGWARRKTGDERNAYRIAKRIGERGTSPQPYLEPALEAKRGEIRRMFERELGNVLKRFQ